MNSPSNSQLSGLQDEPTPAGPLVWSQGSQVGHINIQANNLKRQADPAYGPRKKSRIIDDYKEEPPSYDTRRTSVPLPQQHQKLNDNYVDLVVPGLPVSPPVPSIGEISFWSSIALKFSYNVQSIRNEIRMPCPTYEVDPSIEPEEPDIVQPQESKGDVQQLRDTFLVCFCALISCLHLIVLPAP